MPRADRYLNILEGKISPESEGPQMFPSLHPLSTSLLLEALTPQDLAGRDLGSQGHSPHSSASSGTAGGRWEMQWVVVWPSPLFLASIQIMNRHQANQVPHVFLPPWPWERLWGGRQSGQCHREEVTSTSLSHSCPGSSGSPEVSSPPVCEMVQ